MPQPFDAVLVIAFGGPQGPADVRPFLANVLRGRRVSPGRVEEVAHHYERFGGVSPLNELTARVRMTRHEFLTPDRKVAAKYHVTNTGNADGLVNNTTIFDYTGRK